MIEAPADVHMIHTEWLAQKVARHNEAHLHSLLLAIVSCVYALEHSTESAFTQLAHDIVCDV